jgi:hypothetical protein
MEAEADLRAGGSNWLTILNTLRTTSTTCTVLTTPCTAPAGTGGVAGLPLLVDPGLQSLPPGKTAMDVRVDLLFRERAFWLFGTGHRLGDLRRLIRQYGRDPESVFPTGTYTIPGGASTVYGPDVTAVISRLELNNPNFTGCLNRDP